MSDATKDLAEALYDLARVNDRAAAVLRIRVALADYARGEVLAFRDVLVGEAVAEERERCAGIANLTVYAERKLLEQTLDDGPKGFVSAAQHGVFVAEGIRDNIRAGVVARGEGT